MQYLCRPLGVTDPLVRESKWKYVPSVSAGHRRGKPGRSGPLGLPEHGHSLWSSYSNQTVCHGETGLLENQSWFRLWVLVWCVCVCGTGWPAGADPGLGADRFSGQTGGAGSAAGRTEHVPGLTGGSKQRPAVPALCPHRWGPTTGLQPVWILFQAPEFLRPDDRHLQSADGIVVTVIIVFFC